MRLLTIAALTVGSLFGLAQLPSEADLERQLAEEQWSYRAEVVESWSTTTTTPVRYTRSNTTLPPTGVIASSTTPTTTTPQKDEVCGRWSAFALAFGWEPHHLKTLGEIAYRESRCEPWQHRTDTDGSSCSGDYRLLQINWAAWGDRITAFGYDCHDLLNPAINLLVAKQIVYDGALEAGYGCGFRPWFMTGDYCI